MPAKIKPVSAKDLQGVREFFTNLKTQFASTATVYEGPIKALFDEVTTKLEAVLSGLPKSADADWCLTDKLDWLFESLSSSNSLISLLTLELSKMKQTAASAAPAMVDTLADALAAGTHLTKEAHEAALLAATTAATTDLVPKNTVDQLCSVAKNLGITEGREAVAAEAAAKLASEKLAGDRTAALTTAGLPLPDADVAAVLQASEEVFAAARTTAESRIKGFTEAGIELSPELAANVWASDAAFKTFQKTVASIPSLKRSAAPTPEPFAAAPAGPTAGTKHIMFG